MRTLCYCHHCPLYHSHMVWLMQQKVHHGKVGTGRSSYSSLSAPQCDFKVFFMFYTFLHRCFIFSSIILSHCPLLFSYIKSLLVFIYLFYAQSHYWILLLFIIFKGHSLDILYQQLNHRLKCLIFSPMSTRAMLYDSHGVNSLGLLLTPAPLH